MAAPILDARDILSGEQGELYATLPDGRSMCVMHAKNIEATVSYDKEQVPILGKRGKGNRKTGETYAGSMTLYYVESVFRELAQNYKDTGEDFYFDMRVTNHDNTTHTGTQVIILRGCNFDELVLAKLDADASVLEEDVSFTFEDWVLDTQFDLLDGFFKD